MKEGSIASVRGGKLGTERRLKRGTVLVREYQDERHTVMMVAGGYAWRETTYSSLSAVARAITGTAWRRTPERVKTRTSI